MKRRTNCCNCGAALPVSAPKCEFCGTRNIDLTMIDFGAAINAGVNHGFVTNI